ncbi:MAG: hypothetical protein RLZZ467_11 [Gemmatimonadota bacterium]|jgi:hypothetical protein
MGIVTSTRSRLLAVTALTGGILLVGAAPASAAISNMTLTASPSPGVVGQSMTITFTCTFPDGEGGNNPVAYISFGSPEFFVDATETGSTTSGGNVTFTFTRTVTPSTVATAVPMAGECDTGPDTQTFDATVDIGTEAATTTTTAPATTTTVGGATPSTTTAVAANELARTGGDVAPFALAGAASLLTGIGVARAARRGKRA